MVAMGCHVVRPMGGRGPDVAHDPPSVVWASGQIEPSSRTTNRWSRSSKLMALGGSALT